MKNDKPPGRAHLVAVAVTMTTLASSEAEEEADDDDDDELVEEATTDEELQMEDGIREKASIREGRGGVV